MELIFGASERNVSVVEADEYDRSFLKLSPDVAVITAMDADHLDIYGTAEAMQEAFIDFTGKVKGGWFVAQQIWITAREGLKSKNQADVQFAKR